MVNCWSLSILKINDGPAIIRYVDDFCETIFRYTSSHKHIARPWEKDFVESTAQCRLFFTSHFSCWKQDDMVIVCTKSIQLPYPSFLEVVSLWLLLKLLWFLANFTLVMSLLLAKSMFLLVVTPITAISRIMIIACSPIIRIISKIPQNITTIIVSATVSVQQVSFRLPSYICCWAIPSYYHSWL